MNVMIDSVDAAKRRAIEAYRELGIVARACEAAGISRQTWYNWLERDPMFADQARDAEEAAIDALEAEARRRAKAGSDILLMFCLKAKRPEYRDHQTIDLHATGQIELAPANLDELRAELVRLAAEAQAKGLLTDGGSGNT